MPTLLFLPGHMCDARAWRPVADRIADMGFDLTHVPLNEDDHVDGMARRALDLCDGPVIPVGFSMGAIVALAIERLAPQRVAALCLVGINASADLPERSADRIRHQQTVRDGHMLDIVRDAFLPAYFAEGCAETEELGALCLGMAAAVGPEAFLRQSEALRTRPDSRPGLSAIGCPTLVVSGAEDRICPPEWHRQTAGAIAGAELAIVPGGHMALLEEPDAMAQRLRSWLARVKEQALV